MSNDNDIRLRAGFNLLEARIALLEARLTQSMIDSQRALGLFFLLVTTVIFLK